MYLPGPTWRQPGNERVLHASRRYDGSTSRKTKGSMADTLQCNLWRRAQTPNRMTHSLHGGRDTGLNNGFTAIGTRIGTKHQSARDSEYVKEHSVLKYVRKKLACYLHDFRRHWFNRRLRLPPPNGRHDQLYEHHIRRLMRRVQQRSGSQGGGRGLEGLRFKSLAAWTLGTRTSLAISLSTAGGRGATMQICGWTLSSLFPLLRSSRGPLLNSN